VAGGVSWWWQQAAGPHGAGSRDPDRQQPTTPVAGAQVADQELDAVGRLAAASGEHPELPAGVAEAWDDPPSEAAGAAGDQDGRGHGFS
jgi:hypothetical protein